MSDLPFGFGLPTGPGGPDLGAMFTQMGQLLSWQGGPVNWDLAMQVARRAAAEGGDRTVSEADRREVAEALRLAELWLDEATVLPAATTSAAAWSRAEWLEGTTAGWKPLVEPVAERIVGTVGEALAAQLPAEMTAFASQLAGMMRALGGAMFGAQVGQALGSLSREVTSSTDVGLPLGLAGRGVLVPSGVTAFGDGLGLPMGEVRLYLALREAAHHRLFAHAPWVRARVASAVEGYARGMHVDTDRLQQAVSSLDPTDPQSVQRAMTEGLLEPEDTPDQQAALTRLETLLALIEGWVDEVVHAAASAHLPTADALRETMRRRRASGGPAEELFAALVGLQLRPRRLREAAELWRVLADLRGVGGRDAVWNHPDLLPDATDLDDPADFARRLVDEGIDTLDLSELEGPSASAGPDGGPGSADGPPGSADDLPAPGADPGA